MIFDQRQANCRGERNPELFFPRGYTRSYESRINQAKAICEACPMKSPCLEVAMDSEGAIDERGRAGIWGGTTPGDRVRLYRRRLDRARQLTRQ